MQQHQLETASSKESSTDEVTPEQREMERLVNALGTKHFKKRDRGASGERKVNMHQHVHAIR